MQATVLNKLGLTEARAGLSELFDQVVNQFTPAIITRRRQEVIMLRRDMLQQSLLGEYRLDVECAQEPDGSTTLSVDTLGIVVNEDTPQGAHKTLIADLREYADEYMARLPLFLNAPNRKPHLPYAMRIILAQDDTEIEQMLRR